MKPEQRIPMEVEAVNEAAGLLVDRLERLAEMSDRDNFSESCKNNADKVRKNLSILIKKGRDYYCDGYEGLSKSMISDHSLRGENN